MPPSPRPATIAQAYRVAVERLASFESRELDAARLIAKITGDDRARIVAHGATPIDDEQCARFLALLERRETGVPLAYLVGSAGFFGRDFFVDERVLVPRPETEHAVEAALALAGDRAALSIADIGTGSGALAVTFACERPGASVFGVDISPDAIDVARRNAAHNNVAQHCTFFIGDLGAPLARFAPCDIVVANLPYVPTPEIAPRPDPVAYEPRLALDGGPDGLDVYRRLVPSLRSLLGAGGVLVLEAGPATCAPLADLVRAELAGWTVDVRADYAGLDRIVTARR